MVVWDLDMCLSHLGSQLERGQICRLVYGFIMYVRAFDLIDAFTGGRSSQFRQACTDVRYV
jgi:hypothetical protein